MFDKGLCVEDVVVVIKQEYKKDVVVIFSDNNVEEMVVCICVICQNDDKDVDGNIIIEDDVMLKCLEKYLFDFCIFCGVEGIECVFLNKIVRLFEFFDGL